MTHTHTQTHLRAHLPVSLIFLSSLGFSLPSPGQGQAAEVFSRGSSGSSTLAFRPEVMGTVVQLQDQSGVSSPAV